MNAVQWHGQFVWDSLELTGAVTRSCWCCVCEMFIPSVYLAHLNITCLRGLCEKGHSSLFFFFCGTRAWTRVPVDPQDFSVRLPGHVQDQPSSHQRHPPSSQCTCAFPEPLPLKSLRTHPLNVSQLGYCCPISSLVGMKNPLPCKLSTVVTSLDLCQYNYS